MKWVPEARLMVYCSLEGSERKRHSVKDRDSVYGDLFPLLYSATQKFNPDFQPRQGGISASLQLTEDILERLRKKYLANLARNTIFLSELAKVLEAFNKIGVSTIVLKGALLLETVYRDIGTREINDLDLLIHKEDLPNATETLSKLGYSFCGTNEGTHAVYSKDILVELHWDLVNKHSPAQKFAFGEVDVDKIWESAIRVKVVSKDAFTMSPEDLIIYLSCHLLKEFYSDPKWLGDIHAVIDTFNIVWDSLVKRSKEFKVSKPVYYALYYANRLFGTPIPKMALDELLPRNGWVEKRLFSLPLHNESLVSWRFLAYLFAIERLIDRIKMIVQLPAYLLKRRRINTAPDYHQSLPS